jgi:hypothetical protein
MPPTDAELLAARERMDPLADEVVARLVAEKGAGQARDFFTLLIRNIEIPLDQVPDYVREYLEGNTAFPAWADPVKLKRAQAVFLDRGIAFMVLLYFKSLPTCYLYGTAAEVLTMTGRLSGREWPETYARRIAETLQFVLDVMRKDGLQPGGISVKTILKVRLMHASVRYFIQHHAEWRQAEWQSPINQTALAMTLMTFGQTMVEGLQQMGQPLDEADAEAYFHAWRVTGHFLGIEEALNPVDLQAGNALMARLLTLNATASDAGKACTAALIAFSKDHLQGKLFDGAPEMFLLRLMGTQHAEMLGVTRKKGCLAGWLPAFTFKLLRLEERLEDRWPDLGQATNALGNAILVGLRHGYRSYKGRGLELPPEMQEAWKIP